MGHFVYCYGVLLIGSGSDVGPWAWIWDQALGPGRSPDPGAQGFQQLWAWTRVPGPWVQGLVPKAQDMLRISSWAKALMARTQNFESWLRTLPEL